MEKVTKEEQSIVLNLVEVLINYPPPVIALSKQEGIVLGNEKLNSEGSHIADLISGVDFSFKSLVFNGEPVTSC